MSVPARYDAFWVPGLDYDIDRDESLLVGLNWLSAAGSNYRPGGVIVMYAKSMVRNAPLLIQASGRWPFVSPRSGGPARRGPVLAIWPPDPQVLEFAERLALDAALCVISGRYDIGPWIEKANAKCLIEGYQRDVTTHDLAPEVVTRLNDMLSFDGHNGFIGAGGKENAIRHLQAVARRADRPTPEAVEAHLISRGETSARGARRARQWYDEIIAGKHHRDYAGRVIR